MLFSIAFVALFTIGGLSGLMLAIAPADFQYHDTYFVVAHFHYVLVPGAIFGIIAGVYYWLPKWTGNMYDEVLGKTHFWMSFISVNITFFPMHFVGLAGMPRRIPDYALQFADFNLVISIGEFIFGLTKLLFLFIILKSIFSLKMFDQVYMLTNGGPGNATQTLAHYIYFHGFKYYDMGYASAVSYLLVIPMLGLTWLYMKLVFLKR